MTTSWIEIDHEVLAQIQSGAEAFVESPNDALRRVFSLAPASGRRCAPLARSTPPEREPAEGTGDRSASVSRRARAGELLPLEAYEIPLLRALARLGGSAYRGKVAEEAGAMLDDELTVLDRKPLQGGEVRWENRLGFARLRLIERGEMRPDSRRGIWELTEAGRARLAIVEKERGEPDHADDEQARPTPEA
jgi:hypothetical protein